MTSTVSSNRGSVKTKTEKLSADRARVEKCRELTKEVLQKFPFLKEAPDIMYWLMATWGVESGWKLWHPKKGGVLNSLHYTATPPNASKLIGKGYYYSNVIQNLIRDPNTTLQQRENIKEGFYPHGISACMGTYHVRGCPNNTGEWRYYQEARDVISEYGLEVDPGVSISSTLFGSDDDVCWRRSIASGMIIFNYKYRRSLEKANKNNPVGAIQTALGGYLGKAGTVDLNGVSPEARVAQLNQTTGEIVTMLQAVEIRKRGDTTVLSQTLIDMSNKEAKETAAGQVTVVAAAPATTNAPSEGKSAKMPGCAVG